MDARIQVDVNPRIRDIRTLFDIDNDDMRVIRDRLDTRFRRVEGRLFASEGKSGGPPWPPLSPAYAKQKAKKFPGRKILARTGRLRRSLTTRGAGHVLFSTTKPRATVTMGSNVPYGEFHARGSGSMPKRDPLQHTTRQERGYVRLAAQYFTEEKLPRLVRALAAWKRVREGA